MSEQRERMERALRECAEQGIPETTDLWPGIREMTAATTRRWRFRILPRTRLGWVFAVLAALLFSTGAYAAAGWVDELFQYSVPEIEKADFGVQLNQRQSVDGMTITLERAYADRNNVVIGYSVEGFDNRREIGLSGVPKLIVNGGTSFEYIGGLGRVTDPSDRSVEEGASSDLAFFEPSNTLDTSNVQRFRAKLTTASEEKDVVFDFEVPVRDLSVIEVGQTVEANGVSMTLDRVENSPARSQAFFCFDPPDDRYGWVPIVEESINSSTVFTNESLYAAGPGESDRCLGYDLHRSVYGQPGWHSITVTEIEGRSQPTFRPEKTIIGPWEFDFEVPEP